MEKAFLEWKGLGARPGSESGSLVIVDGDDVTANSVWAVHTPADRKMYLWITMWALLKKAKGNSKRLLDIRLYGIHANVAGQWFCHMYPGLRG